MAKPLPRRVPCDDCIVTIDGELYALHEGEWVDILGDVKVGDLSAFRHLTELEDRLAAVAGDSDEEKRTLALTDEAWGSALDILRQRVVAWSWTDDAADPLPQPKADPAVFGRLRFEEVAYLLRALRRNTPAEAKNG